ncbi:MAG: TIGR01212 family radical SAM protein [Candidatus Omnitrophota bacterium]
MKERFYSFNSYLRREFGVRTHKISLNAGFNCPNLDGALSSEGCVFCDNKAFSYFANSDPLSLEEQIYKSMDYARKRFKAEKFIAYFQSFSNTYGDIAFLKEQYSVIRKFKDIVGISISTRPDCINDEKLDVIEEFSKDYKVFIEYGLQTCHNKTLKLINRNHTFEDFEKAVELTAKRTNIKIGAHVILGLPRRFDRGMAYETKEDVLSTAKTLSKMPIWGIKFHCLHIVKNTALENMYNKGKVSLLSEDEYIDMLISFLEVTPEERVILRLVSDADRNLLIAPLWVNEKQRVLKKIEKEFEKRNAYQGKSENKICRDRPWPVRC